MKIDAMFLFCFTLIFSNDASCGPHKTYAPGLCLGRQPHSNVFAFSESLQFTEDGQIISDEQQEFV